MSKQTRNEKKTIDFNVKALLGTTQISYEEFFNLAQDDLLVLKQDINSPLRVIIGEKSYIGIPGVYEQKRALKIKEGSDE